MPDQPLQLTKRTTYTLAFGFGLIDGGTAVMAGRYEGDRAPEAPHIALGYTDNGGLLAPGPLDELPVPTPIYISSRLSETHQVRNIALALDPLVPNPDWDAATLHHATVSYTRCLSLLYAGALTLETTPFLTVIPVAELNLVRYEPLPSPLVAPVWEGRQSTYDWDQIPVVEGEARVDVQLSVPSQSIQRPTGIPEVWAWPGIVSIAIDSVRDLSQFPAP